MVQKNRHKIIEKATPHNFGAEGLLALARKIQAAGSLSRGQASDIKAVAEAAEETGVDLVVSLGNTGYHAVRQGGSRSQPLHWALVYCDAEGGTGTQPRDGRDTVRKTLIRCKEKMIGSSSG